jgi:methionyl-tRNA formyltransferase
MRIAFAGTPTFAAVALQALSEARFDIALVLTQPDRPAGRGLRQMPGPVKQLAVRLGLNLAQPATLRNEETVDLLRSTGAQALVVAAYGLILPATVLAIFPAGCINIHASLLPRWRGAAPIQRAILAGDRETGISIMRMEQGLDTGPVYLTRKIPILADDSAGTLHDKLAALGARSIVDALAQIARGALNPSPQSVDGVTYANKISKAEAAIDWQRDAADVDRQVRAFNPFPGAFSQLSGETIKIWRGHPVQCAPAVPGEILASTVDGIDVACGSGMLRITELQRAGSRRLSAAEFLRGAAPAPGQRFHS